MKRAFDMEDEFEYESDKTIDDLLGFDFGKFLANAIAGGTADSPCFPHLSFESIQSFEEYYEPQGIKLRMKYLNDSLAYVCKHSDVHNAITMGLNNAFTEFNTLVSGNFFIPFEAILCADMKVNKHVCQPDACVYLGSRTTFSPTFVLETHFASSISEVQFYDKLGSYITGTEGIMVVMGIKIFQPNPAQRDAFGAICVVLERNDDGEGFHVTSHTSFGSGSIPPTENGQRWLNAVAKPAVGVGIDNHVPCNDANQDNPTFAINLNLTRLLARNNAVPYEYDPCYTPEQVAPHAVTLRLFPLQSFIATLINDYRRFEKPLPGSF